jgi:hypothetical protein
MPDHDVHEQGPMPETRGEVDAAFEKLKGDTTVYPMTASGGCQCGADIAEHGLDGKCPDRPTQSDLGKVDNWAHRSEGMRCSTCMWYAPKNPAGGKFSERILGRCRRHAPTMNGWPVMFERDWCGDHKLDENKYPTVAAAMEAKADGSGGE